MGDWELKVSMVLFEKRAELAEFEISAGPRTQSPELERLYPLMH